MSEAMRDYTLSSQDGTPSKSHPPGSGMQQRHWRPSGWHVSIGLVTAVLLLLIPAPQNYDRIHQIWSRGQSTATDGTWAFSSTTAACHSARGMCVGPHDQQTTALIKAHRKEEKGSLLYSSGKFKQPTYSCPFDFSLPAPSDDNGTSYTYSECLARHGRPLDQGYDYRWFKMAAQSRDSRGAFITQHVVDYWLWTLRRGIGTPCRPAIVTYICKDDGRVCGGLGDRVRGQNMAFWQAVLSNSFFISQWERPVAIQEYLLPKWLTLEFPDIRACLSASGNASAKVVPWYRPQYYNTKGIIEFNYVEEWRGADIIESRSNALLFPEFLRAPSLAPTIARYRLTELPMSHLLRTGLALYLSRPSEFLLMATQQFEQLWSPPGAFTVGIHLRVGGKALGDPTRQPLKSAHCFAREALAQCADAAPRPCAVYLAADSEKGISAVRQGLQKAGVPVVTAGGLITHNDKPELAPAIAAGDPEALIKQAARTYIDWYMLSRMDGLVMSHSGFSFAAAWAASPAMARWMDLQQAKMGQCRFVDFNARCRGDRCVGIGLPFLRGDPTDELGSYGSMSSQTAALEQVG